MGHSQACGISLCVDSTEKNLVKSNAWFVRIFKCGLLIQVDVFQLPYDIHVQSK